MTDLLAGVRVLDFTHVLAGPYCTMILADLGAEIVKVEPTHEGDPVRAVPPFVGDQSHYFLSINRNKTSFACDIRDSRVRDLLKRLSLTCDVVVDNFRPDVLKKFGLDYESLSVGHPGLIGCSITGFGSDSSWRDRPSFDLVNQAMSGVMSVTGEPDGHAVKAGIPIGDLAGGLWAAIGIMAALVKRQRTGVGSRVEVTLMDGLLALLGYLGQLALLQQSNLSRVGNGHHSIVPYGRYDTSDGELVLALHVGRFWKTFVTAAEDSRLSDRRFLTSTSRLEHRADLERTMTEVMASRTTADWEGRLLAFGVPHARVLGVYDALTSAFAQERGILKTMNHPSAGTLKTVSSPVIVNGERAGCSADEVPKAPQLGEGTFAVLAALGVQENEAMRLLQDGVIRGVDGQTKANEMDERIEGSGNSWPTP